MSDTQKEPATAPGTQEQIDAIIAWIEYYGPRRAKVLHSDFHEADFLVGGMAALMALGANDRIPPEWVFSPMSGRHLFSKDRNYLEEEREEDERSIQEEA